LGSFKWLINLWFILLTSSIFTLCQTYFFCATKLDEPCVLYVCCAASREFFLKEQEEPELLLEINPRITGIARVDGVIHSTDPIFASSHKLCSRHVFYTCAFRMLSMRGKDTLHSNGGCPRLDAAHAAA
jgi:hypothetical protein